MKVDVTLVKSKVLGLNMNVFKVGVFAGADGGDGVKVGVGGVGES